METSLLKKLFLKNYKDYINTIQSLSKEELIYSNGIKWNALQQTSHLIKSIKIMNLIFLMPKFLIKLIFGTILRKIKSYDEIVNKYVTKLNTGSKADKIYQPSNNLNPNKVSQLLDTFLKSVENSICLLNKFSEEELNTLQILHPILGKITLKELLFFATYHVTHHQNSILKMLKEK